jgi:hypothetical protein
VTLRGRQLPKALPALATAVIIASAAALWHNLPEPTDVYGPFDVHAAVGQQATGRDVITTVTGVRIGPRVHSVWPPGKTRQAVGVWIVVDAVVTATGSYNLPRVELIAGPNTYSPSDWFRPAPLGAELEPGIAARGSWVFDVRADLLDAAHFIALRVWVGDGRLDSRLVIRIPLDDQRVRRDEVVTLEPVTTTAI